MFRLGIFLFLASALALPHIHDPPCLPGEFTLEIYVNQTWQALYGICDSKQDFMNVVVKPTDHHKGTPVGLVGPHSNAQLYLNLDGHKNLNSSSGHFDLNVGDDGDRDGSYVVVIGVKQSPYDGFIVKDRGVWNQQTDADQTWYACDIIIDSSRYTTLGWGIENANGSWPYGCAPTRVRQKFDLKCGDS